jgi:hypothetical protein
MQKADRGDRTLNLSFTKPTEGIEPSTSALRKLCSTIELGRRQQAAIIAKQVLLDKRQLQQCFLPGKICFSP